MKVIFLDVDGVLNSEEDLKIYREKNGITGCILYDNVEERPLKLLKQIVDVTGAVVVLSSSWRLGYGKTESIFGGRLYEKVRSALEANGMEIYDITPHIVGAQRGDEIKQWLSNKQDVESFVILDDDLDMGEYTSTNLIQTTYKYGLLPKHVEHAIKKLEYEYQK